MARIRLFYLPGKLDAADRFCIISLLPGVGRPGAVVDMSVGEVESILPTYCVDRSWDVG